MSEYHDRIMRRVKDQQEQQDQERGRRATIQKYGKEKRAFDKLPEQTETEFWCDECEQDFKAPAHKHWLEFYEIGTWRSFCSECGGGVYRQITDKGDDLYYEKSLKIRIMRAEFESDMLQPNQYGFETMYGQAHEAWYSGREAREKEIRGKYAALGLHGTSLKERDDIERLREEFEGQ